MGGDLSKVTEPEMQEVKEDVQFHCASLNKIEENVCICK